LVGFITLSSNICVHVICIYVHICVYMYIYVYINLSTYRNMYI
jgi:hypothetical protein